MLFTLSTLWGCDEHHYGTITVQPDAYRPLSPRWQCKYKCQIDSRHSITSTTLKYKITNRRGICHKSHNWHVFGARVKLSRINAKKLSEIYRIQERVFKKLEWVQKNFEFVQNIWVKHPHSGFLAKNVAIYAFFLGKIENFGNILITNLKYNRRLTIHIYKQNSKHNPKMNTRSHLKAFDPLRFLFAKEGIMVFCR